MTTDGVYQQIWPFVLQVDFMPVYHEHLRNIIKKGVDHPKHYDTPLKGFHIVLDAGNGGGGFLATHVLEPLGANIDGENVLMECVRNLICCVSLSTQACQCML